jgi:hypothetical protein
MRGGLELSFKGKGVTVVLLTLVPHLVEALCAAVMSKYVLGLPWSLSFPNGFLLGALSPGVVVPSVMILIEKKYGTKKGIPQTMLAACSFDNLFSVLVFKILVAVSFNEISEFTDGKQEKIGSIVLFGLLYSFVGISVGYLLGLSFKILDKCTCFSTKGLMRLKAVAMVIVAFTIPVVSAIL